MASPSAAPRLAMVAGEASGDLLASLLLSGLRARWPQLRAVGIGGPRMAEQAFEAWWPHHKLAVRGYAEVLRHYREIVGIRDQLRLRLLQDPPAVFIGVDAPDFNLDLAAALKVAGVPTVQFVCPSIWAWRAERVAKLKRSVNHVLCLFPFEPELLHRHGIGATFVGHPLASVIPMFPDQAAARQSLGLALDAPVLALMPGSRASEIDHLAARFMRAARLLAQRRPGLQVVLPIAPGLRNRVEAIWRQVGPVPGLQLLEGQSHAALAACDLTLVASGTATLEAALYKRPMVIAYHMHPISWWLTRRKQLQPWVGLPNILAQEFLVPELLQERATPQALCAELNQWLTQPQRLIPLQRRFEVMHQSLIRDTARSCADAIQNLLAR
ncbi:MAG: lipid-A-disaccharide synthase [Alphaproteobacteria bacterium]|nr:lipid-A-disaccharide synthase [Alphaproteobacteria bacterium]